MGTQTRRGSGPHGAWTTADLTSYLEDEAHPELTKSIETVIAAGKATWIPDPEVEGVYGLLLVENGRPTSQALVVVYTNSTVGVGGADWEEDWLTIHSAVRAIEEGSAA